MRWPWSKHTEPEQVEPEPEEVEGEDDAPPKPLGLMSTKDGNKHTPTKHKAFPNRMNRNKRMP